MAVVCMRRDWQAWLKVAVGGDDRYCSCCLGGNNLLVGKTGPWRAWAALSRSTLLICLNVAGRERVGPWPMAAAAWTPPRCSQTYLWHPPTSKLLSSLQHGHRSFAVLPGWPRSQLSPSCCRDREPNGCHVTSMPESQNTVVSWGEQHLKQRNFLRNVDNGCVSSNFPSLT